MIVSLHQARDVVGLGDRALPSEYKHGCLKGRKRQSASARSGRYVGILMEQIAAYINIRFARSVPLSDYSSSKHVEVGITGGISPAAE